ncbi:MAG: hypothetical protein ACOCQN_03200 [Halanaerobiaceae bacterium]
MSVEIAISFILFASFMWGSWLQFVKFIKKWTINEFMVILYSFSLVFTWVILGLGNGAGAYGELFVYLGEHPQLLLFPLVGGFLYTTGMWFNLSAVDIAGLTLTFIIFSAIATIFGTALSIMGGGLPPGTSLLPVLFGALLMVGAVGLSSKAGDLRDKEKDVSRTEKEIEINRAKIIKVIKYAVVSGLFVSSFPYFMTLSLKSSYKSVGLDAYQYMALLAIGSMIAISVLCIRPIIKTRKFKRMFAVPWSYFGMAVLSGVAHYGGNIMNAMAAPVVGLAISWPLAQTMALWGTFWGLVHGEFKGSSRRVYLLIFSAIALFVVGTYILSRTVYS